MNHNVPESLTELSFPDSGLGGSLASRLWKGVLPWDAVPSTRMCLNIAGAWFPPCLLPFGFCPSLHLKPTASVPWALPVVAGDSIPAFFSVPLMTFYSWAPVWI